MRGNVGLPKKCPAIQPAKSMDIILHVYINVDNIPTDT